MNQNLKNNFSIKSIKIMPIKKETWDKIHPIAQKIGVLEMAIKYNHFESYGLKNRVETYQRLNDLREEIQSIYFADLFNCEITLKKRQIS